MKDTKLNSADLACGTLGGGTPISVDLVAAAAADDAPSLHAALTTASYSTDTAAQVLQAALVHKSWAAAAVVAQHTVVPQGVVWAAACVDIPAALLTQLARRLVGVLQHNLVSALHAALEVGAQHNAHVLLPLCAADDLVLRNSLAHIVRLGDDALLAQIIGQSSKTAINDVCMEAAMKGTLVDLQRVADTKVPFPVRTVLDGAAHLHHENVVSWIVPQATDEDLISVAANRAAWSEWDWVERMLAHVHTIDASPTTQQLFEEAARKNQFNIVRRLAHVCTVDFSMGHHTMMSNVIARNNQDTFDALLDQAHTGVPVQKMISVMVRHENWAMLAAFLTRLAGPQRKKLTKQNLDQVCAHVMLECATHNTPKYDLWQQLISMMREPHTTMDKMFGKRGSIRINETYWNALSSYWTAHTTQAVLTHAVADVGNVAADKRRKM